MKQSSHKLDSIGIRFDAAGMVANAGLILPATLGERPGVGDLRYYNDSRPHRALQGRTPAQAFADGLHAGPSPGKGATQYRVRHDRIDSHGSVTLRYLSRLRHIRVGAAHRGQPVHIFVAGADVRIVSDDGRLLRALTIDPDRVYQPLNGRRPVRNLLEEVSGMS